MTTVWPIARNKDARALVTNITSNLYDIGSLLAEDLDVHQASCTLCETAPLTCPDNLAYDAANRALVAAHYKVADLLTRKVAWKPGADKKKPGPKKKSSSETAESSASTSKRKRIASFLDDECDETNAADLEREEAKAARENAAEEAAEDADSGEDDDTSLDGFIAPEDE